MRLVSSTHATLTPRPPATGRPRGFAFTEVLFAVMVLGLGFILIAAMFPVTIRQTQSTMEEANAASLAQGAMEYLQSVAAEDLFPPTVPPTQGPPTRDGTGHMDLSEPAEVVSLPHVFYRNPQNLGSNDRPKAWGTDPMLPAYYTVRGNMIDPRNPRVAWIPLYRRLNNSPFAQVFMIVVQSRNREQYVAERDRTGLFPDRKYSDFDPPEDVQNLPPNQAQTVYSTLEPRYAIVGVEYDNTLEKGVVTIEPKFRELAATGAYLIIAKDPNDGQTALPLKQKGQSNGRVYQLGNPIDEANGEWELAPATEMIRTGTDKTVPQVGDDNELPYVFPEDKKKSTYAYIVGRGYKDPMSAAEGYGGPAQEISVYTGFIHVPPTPPAQQP